jgi:HPt (histidine-containing phosphotransfer) domain-containing protein
MLLRATRIVVLAALAAITLQACGGGLSKEEFIEAADEICEKADERSQELDPPTNPRALRVFVERAEQITRQLIEDLRELEPPEGDRDTIERMIDKIEEAIGYLPAIEKAARLSDVAAIQQLGARLQAAAAEANELARDYGMKKCGRAAPAAPEGGG